MQNTFGQIVLPSMRGIFNSKIPTTMYSGGKGLGTAEQSILQNDCPPEQIQTIYYGGIGFGNQQEVILQNSCVPPSIETIFYGGIGYGNQQEIILQNICQSPSVETIFYGGNGFGDQQKSVIQNACLAPAIEAIFSGGNGFGDQQQKVIQTDCNLFNQNNNVSISIPTVTSAGGREWMDRNLGALQVASSVTDATAYGDLYQWGRGNDNHQLRTSGSTTTLSNTDTPGNNLFIYSSTDWRSSSNTNLWQGLSGTNNPCPNGFRIPTKAEWEIEIASWSSQNKEGGFASPLKLPTPGFRNYSNGVVANEGLNGDYWSSTVDGANSFIMYIHVGAGTVAFPRAYGFTCRCIKE